MRILVRLLRLIVHNDAMRSDPEEIYGWRVFALVFSSCFGGMLFGWDTGAIGGVLAMEQTQMRFGYYDKTAKQKSTLDQNIVSTLQAGCFLACFLTSWFTERFGRRWCLISTGALTGVGVIFQASSCANGSLAVMYVGRFIAGLGVGAASTLVPLYVSECAPRGIRGGLTCKSCIVTIDPGLPNLHYSLLPTLHRYWDYALFLVRLVHVGTSWHSVTSR